MALINTNVTTVASNIYASTGNSVVITVYLCNYSGSTVTANLYAVPSGNSAGSLTQIGSNISISSHDTYIMNYERLVLGNGDALVANANANSAVCATVSYSGV
jgi:hypothetical protein